MPLMPYFSKATSKLVKKRDGKNHPKLSTVLLHAYGAAQVQVNIQAQLRRVWDAFGVWGVKGLILKYNCHAALL